MSSLFGGTPPIPRPAPPAPDLSGEMSQSAMEAERRRAALATGREKLINVPSQSTQTARPSGQKLLLGA